MRAEGLAGAAQDPPGPEIGRRGASAQFVVAGEKKVPSGRTGWRGCAFMLAAALPLLRETMAQTSTKTTDFNRALGDAKRQAGGVADAVTDAAQDVYDQAVDSASDVADTAKSAVRKTAGSFEQAIRNTIETQPYTAAAIALGIGWLLGRMHRPL